jgi:Fic family protein
VLRQDTDAYVRRLTAFRHADPAYRPEAVSQFVAYFAGVLVDSSDEAERVIRESQEVQDDWAERLSRFRSDSKVHDAVSVLADQPVVTARYLQAALHVSGVTARTVVDSLVDVGVLEPSGGRLRRSEVYQASALLRMMDRLVPGTQPSDLPASRSRR